MNTQLDYVIWRNVRVPNGAELNALEAVERRWELRDGVPRGHDFDQDAVFPMDLELPHNMYLPDSLMNINSLIVASQRLKDFLSNKQLESVEYLPVSIRDHKGRITKKNYFIVHPIEPVDCLDLDASEADYSPLDPSLVDDVEQLVFDEEKLDDRRELFRPKYFPDITLVRRALAEEIDKQGFEGVGWLEIDEYES